MRRWHLAGFALLAALVLACEGTGTGSGTGGATPGGAATGLPSSMAALGDSITAGFGSCLTLLACERRSWSTGSDSIVDSHYRRLLDDNKKIKGRAHNYSSPGARVGDLDAQARSAVAAKAAYITVLIGANDACARRVEDMTAVRTFRRGVDSALRTLQKGLPKSRVLVVSIPDLYRLWQVGHDEPKAVRAWNRGICPSLLAHPTSTAAADEQRRRRVASRIDDYNTELEAACRAYGKRCRTDDGRVHATRFSLTQVNRLDYFHPNAEGQATLAEVTWPAAGW